MTATIHPTAFVSPKAQIGNNVTIGQCALIEDDVIIGDNCEIHPFASVKQYTEMGTGNIIHSYAMVGGIPQDLKFKGEESWLKIGNNNSIREFSTLHRGTEGGGGLTTIGSNNLFMAYIHVAHDCHLGDSIVMSNGATLAGHVTVQSHAIIGGLSAVHQFARVGEHAFVGGMTGVTQDLPPFMLAVGSRGGLHGPNIVGLRRMGASSQAITAVRAVFRMIWLSGTPRQEAIAKAEEEYGHFAEVQQMLAFIKESTRGILPLAKQPEA